MPHKIRDSRDARRAAHYRDALAGARTPRDLVAAAYRYLTAALSRMPAGSSSAQAAAATAAGAMRNEAERLFRDRERDRDRREQATEQQASKHRKATR